MKRDKAGEAGRGQILTGILSLVEELDCVSRPQALIPCPIPPDSQV